MRIRVAKKIVNRTAKGINRGKYSSINTALFLVQRRIGRDFAKSIKPFGKITSKQTPYQFLQDVYLTCRANWSRND